MFLSYLNSESNDSNRVQTTSASTRHGSSSGDCNCNPCNNIGDIAGGCSARTCNNIGCSGNNITNSHVRSATGSGNTHSSNCNIDGSSNSIGGSSNPASVYGMERLLHAVREEFQTEDELEDEVEAGQDEDGDSEARGRVAHRSSTSSSTTTTSDTYSSDTSSLPPPLPLPSARRRLQRGESFGSLTGPMAAWTEEGLPGSGSSAAVAGGVPGAPVRRFRRSSIGIQRKSAFRQRKLDSLGAWRRKR